ncbi:MAG: peptidase [Verrucomicrobia bacterium]|nr:peptidase [Verrucomicrobiota bacterium]
MTPSLPVPGRAAPGAPRQYPIPVRPFDGAASAQGLVRCGPAGAWPAVLGLLAMVLGTQVVAAGEPAGPLPPAGPPGLAYTNEFFPGTRYRPTVPTQQEIVGFTPGQRAASAAEVAQCLRAWAGAAPERTRLVEYARSHEGRALHYLVVTAPENLGRLEAIRTGLARLADPRTLAEGEARRLVRESPAVGWAGFTIHGDETEGSDAALVLVYHLVAAEDPAVAELLKNVVVIVDPLMNPDGRDRFVKTIAEHRGALPNVDSQSLVHAGYWPRGRGNHYLFDLNRDSILGVHPETRGRLREFIRWNPQLFIDGHGMGPFETHLFSPPRPPINPNIPDGRGRWAALFARDQAQAFDREHLLYYTGEWHEEWYPGYCDAWASSRGAIGILYEQARVAENGVRRPDGRILSYRESMRHHVIGAMANLTTLSRHRQALLEYFVGTRRAAVAAEGAYANRTFAVLPTANRSRLQDLAATLQVQGIEVFEAASSFVASRAVDQLGRSLTNAQVPAGTLLVPNRQPLGHLVAAILEFDPRLPREVLQEERREVLRTGRSRIYDVTAWNLTMLFGLEAWTLAQPMPADPRPWAPASAPPRRGMLPGGGAVAWVLDGADDRSVAAAARLMEQGVEVRVADKPFRFEGTPFARGSVVITRLDNRGFDGDLQQTVARTADALNLATVAVGTGLGEGDLPDLGGRHFRRLQPPRIAVLGRGAFSPTDYGATWYVLDKHLGIRHSHLEEGRAPDLARYNVVVAPDRGGAPLPEALATALKDWVKGGGTLVAVGNSAAQFTPEKAAFSKVRTLPDVLGRLPEYELAVLREWLAWTGALPADEATWAHTVTPDLRYPWPAAGGALPDEKELKKRDAWQGLFMPEGTLLAGRVDTNHWLTAGCGERLPLLVGTGPVLMSAGGVETPIRHGCWTRAETNPPVVAPAHADANPVSASGSGKPGTAAKPELKPAPRIGWCAPPEGMHLQLRMSGLLWPEAAHRLANAAAVTRESFGRGQIILFAAPPVFRASSRGAMRAFQNALVYGPGFGAAQTVTP